MKMLIGALLGASLTIGAAMGAMFWDDAQPARRDPDGLIRRVGSFPPLGALPAPFIPPDNPMSQAKVELGRMLFFDTRTSGDVSTSCASCHDPVLGWGDGSDLSRGYPGALHWRNSQTVINAAYYQKLFWAGESKSLEKQANSAITGNLAGNGDPIMIEERLAQCPDYVQRFRDVFGTRRPLYSDVLKAIATYERTLVQRDTPFDKYVNGDAEALTAAAKRGLVLFQGKAGCIKCHNGPFSSDQDYHALGVPDNEAFEWDPLRQIALRYQHYARGVPEAEYRSARTDQGLYYTTKRDADRGLFRTPTLRYLEFTPPYMHNGAFFTLEEVIDFYDEGGGESANKSPLLQPLNLTEEQKADLLDFLLAMTGDEIIHDPPSLPAYEVLPVPGLTTSDPQGAQLP